MSRKQREMDARLDDMLSRIAMETQEIKELEQQLTNGQILANQFLQRDLTDIISGLQEYLRGLRDQASRAQQKADSLEEEKQTLQRQLQDMQAHCRLLENTISSHRQAEKSTDHQSNDQSNQSRCDLHKIETQLEQLVEKLSIHSCHGNLLDSVLLRVSDLAVTLRQQHSQQMIGRPSCHSQQDEEEEEGLREDLKRVRTKLKKSQNALRHAQNNMRSAEKRSGVELDHLREELRRREEELNHLGAELEENRKWLQEVQEDRDALLEQYLCSPEGRGRCRDTPPAGGGYWVYMPPLHTHTECVCEQQTDGCVCELGERDREERRREKPENTQSSQCVCVWGEVACVETTLLRRRAELRRTDRLLLDAQTCLMDTTRKASEAKQMLICTQTEVEEMERRAEHSATFLLEAKQHIRTQQEELGELRRGRKESEARGGASASGHHSYCEGST